MIKPGDFMKTRAVRFLLALLFLSAGSVWAQPPPAKVLKVPKDRWLDGERGYLEALEIQKATGADILLYFFRYDLKDEHGLCIWWERKGLQNGKVTKHLQDYIKVKMQLPFRKKELETFKAFKFNKTPAVYVAKPTGYPTKLAVFDWPNGKPELKEGFELVELITKVSSPKPDADAPASP